MLTDYFETFTLLDPHPDGDALGGYARRWKAVMSFQGALTQVAAQETPVAEHLTLKATPMLLHEFDVTLAPDDHVRRESTGAIYRVTGQSDDMRTPAHAGLQFAQVPVERLVSVC